MSDLQIKLKITAESRKDKSKVDGLPRIGQWTVQEIRQNIINAKITATGKTQRSIEYRINGEKELQIVSVAGEHAPVNSLQYGRAPGKRPPIENLKEWILAKQIKYTGIPYKRRASDLWKPKYTPQERGLNKLAWVISYKIMKEGTKRYKNNNLEIYTPVLNETVSLFKDYILNKTETAVISTLIK